VCDGAKNIANGITVPFVFDFFETVAVFETCVLDLLRLLVALLVPLKGEVVVSTGKKKFQEAYLISKSVL
jgi:hypothetical protein